MALRAMGLDGPGTSEDELWDVGGREALAGHLRELADARLAEKESAVGETDWAMVERLVLLRTIDSLWVEHLTELDDMRRGIGLRGYAQQDPLNEFKKEAFSLYDQLRGADPAPGGDHHLPGPGDEAAGRPDTRRGAARGQPRGRRHGPGDRPPRGGRRRGRRAPRRPRRSAAAGSWPGGFRRGRRSGPCSSRSVIEPPRPPRAAGRERSWAATIPATAARGSSTRSATGAERRRRRSRRKLPLGHSAFAAYTPLDAAHAHGERTR